MVMIKYKPAFLFLALLGTCSAAYLDFAPSNRQHQFTHGASIGDGGFGGRPGSNVAFGGKPGGAEGFSGRPTSSGGPGFEDGSSGHTGAGGASGGAGGIDGAEGYGGFSGSEAGEFVGSASGVSNDFHSIPSDPIEALTPAIPGGGIPGSDYPILAFLPDTGFTCDTLTGYYADTGSESQCQVFHICHEDGRKDSFLCPNGTIFQQQYFVCDWWFNVDCSSSSQFYELNAEIGKTDAGTDKEFGMLGDASGTSGFEQAATAGSLDDPAGGSGGFGAPAGEFEVSASGGVEFGVHVGAADGFGAPFGGSAGGFGGQAGSFSVQTGAGEFGQGTDSGFGDLGAASAVGGTSAGSGVAAPSTLYDFPSVGNGQNGGGTSIGNRGSIGGAGSIKSNRGAASGAGNINSNRGAASGAGSRNGNRGVASDAGSRNGNRGGINGITVGNRIGSQAVSEQNGRVAIAPSSLYGAPNQF